MAHHAVMAGHSPSKTGVNALVSRPSRLMWHDCVSLIGIVGASPAMTINVSEGWYNIRNRACREGTQMLEADH
jgi:hypothetical protein